MGRAAIAFSGGVDSGTLLAMAVRTLSKENVLAVILNSPLSPGGEVEEARDFCSSLGVEHILIEEGDLSPLADNPPERCYICKKISYRKIWEVAQGRGFEHLLDGTNRDDFSDYRPGLKAREELGVRSPLAEVGMGKKEVRELAFEMGLPFWDKPSSPCLASRIPFGQKITREKLRMIGEAEGFLRSLGFREVRVRCHEEGRLARIEVPKGNLERIWERKEEIRERLKGIGFKYITLDLEGYKMGSLNP